MEVIKAIDDLLLSWDESKKSFILEELKSGHNPKIREYETLFNKVISYHQALVCCMEVESKEEKKKYVAVADRLLNEYMDMRFW